MLLRGTETKEGKYPNKVGSTHQVILKPNASIVQLYSGIHGDMDTNAAAWSRLVELPAFLFKSRCFQQIEEALCLGDGKTEGPDKKSRKSGLPSCLSVPP